LRSFDLIHLHYPFFFGAEMVWAAARLFGVPYVATYHNALIGDGRRAVLFRIWEQSLGQLVLGGSRRLVAVSLDHAMSQPWLAAQPPDMLVEIPNGVDTTTFHPGADDAAIRARFGIDPATPVLLFVAALDRAHHFKGLSRLLAAVEPLRDQGIAVLVAGDGDQRGRYEAEVDQRGLREVVHFAGAVAHRDLPPYFAAAGVLALPTGPPESFGMVLIESLACGTPVIASDIPGVRAVVRQTGGGILVPLGDVDALTGAITRLLSDHAMRRQLGATGRAVVVSDYDWRTIGPRLEALYREVLATPARRPAATTTAAP
jgi:glycosyltransferase involved in cell wall biosynthesis